MVLLELGDAEAQGWIELGAAAQRISAASDCDGGSRGCAAPSPDPGARSSALSLSVSPNSSQGTEIGFLVFAASLGFSVSILLLSPVRSKAEQTLASSECLAPLSAIAYAKTFNWSCLKCSYNYRVHIYSHPLPLTLCYLVLGVAFPANHPACCWCFLPSTSHCSAVWESSLLHPTDLLMLSQDWFQTGNQEKCFLNHLLFWAICAQSL